MKRNVIVLITILIILVSFFLFDFFIRYTLEDFQQNNIEIVVSRYNEDLEWLKDEPFNKYPIVIYNKGVNDDFYKPNNTKIIKLANVGRCDHTYLYHIVNNYDNLPENTIFLPGSANMHNKIDKAKEQVYEMEKHNNTVILGSKYNNVKNDLYGFSIDSHIATDTKNSSMNNETKLEISRIRPFGKWFEHHFGDTPVQYISYFGILGINKKHILLRKKEFYEKLLAEVSNSSNPEVGHYLERAWNAVFIGFGIIYKDVPLLYF